MTRRDQMLDDFDALAAAELEDIATSNRSSEPIEPLPQVLQGQVQTFALGSWDWVIGLGVIGLVVLAARR